VAERQRNLQQKCRKSEPRTTSSMEPNPPHNRHANVTMLHLARGTTLRALLDNVAATAPASGAQLRASNGLER
jgi:hypothetical protein